MLTYTLRRRPRFVWLEADRISGRSGGSRLALDVHQDDEAYELTAPVPGLAADEVHIEIENDVLTVRGKAGEPGGERGEYLLREIAPVEFERSLRFPLPVDAARAEASLENGLLKIRIPKAEEARPKTIPVRAS